MGALSNIYCIPRTPTGVAWATLIATLADRALVRAPYRSGSPYEDASCSAILWPENWIVPETLRLSSSALPLRDFETRQESLTYVAHAADATITMGAPQSSFQVHPDRREFSGAVALYRFRAGFRFRIGVPEDFSDLADEFPELANQPTEPRWQGEVTELLWIHGKCVPPEEEFVGSPIHQALEACWPGFLLLSDAFP